MSQLLDAIRTAIEADPRSRYQISKDVGIGESQLSRLMSGTAGLSVERLEQLADFLELEITIRPRKKGHK